MEAPAPSFQRRPTSTPVLYHMARRQEHPRQPHTLTVLNQTGDSTRNSTQSVAPVPVL
jgi:hypothetical protein